MSGRGKGLATLLVLVTACSSVSAPVAPPSTERSDLPPEPVRAELPPVESTQPSTVSLPFEEGSSIWPPGPGTTWHWQLTESLDLEVDAAVFDVDLFTTSRATVTEIKSRGRYVVCYISAGAWEDFRPDSAAFPDLILGNPNGWPGERWLDIRRIDLLAPILEARLDLCVAKGFDGVEMDNVDGYQNDSGFDLSIQDQIDFNRYLAREAHSRGLEIGLKNALDLVAQLEPDFNFAINEECASYGECSALKPFIAAGKAVFHVEYDLAASEFCRESAQPGLSSMRKRPELDAWFERCP